MPDNESLTESVNARSLPATFYELLEAIRKRPSMYLGRKSLHDFRFWLHGYRYAKLEARIPPSSEEEEFAGFDEFVCQKYDWFDAGGWNAKIAYYNRDDAMALDEFFNLLDEFREGKRPGKRV